MGCVGGVGAGAAITALWQTLCTRWRNVKGGAPAVTPSQVHTVDLKPPPRCGHHRAGCFDSPPTRAHIAGAALRQVASAAERSAAALSVRGQKQLPLIQFVPLGASGAEFKSGLSLPRSQVGDPVHAPIHSSGVTHWLFFFFFPRWPALTVYVWP